MDGILIIDKPTGITSHDVVSQVRRILDEGRIGHAGTLDPMATGVLVLGVGKGTRLLEYLTGQQKRYRGTIRLGVTTTTYDTEGEIVEQIEGPWPARSAVEDALTHFRGDIEQYPPAYSAIKQDGEPLYAKARRGEEVNVEPRAVTIHSLILLEYEPPALVVDVTCSKGTYVRSLAHDIGQALEVGGHLTDLRRLSSGSFTLDDAITLDALSNAAAEGRAEQFLLPLGAGLDEFPRLDMDAATARRLAHGQFVEGPAIEGLARAMLGERLVAITEYDESRRRWRPRKVFMDPTSINER